MVNFANLHRDRSVTETDKSIPSQITKDKPFGSKRDVLISYATLPGKAILLKIFI